MSEEHPVLLWPLPHLKRILRILQSRPELCLCLWTNLTFLYPEPACCMVGGWKVCAQFSLSRLCSGQSRATQHWLGLPSLCCPVQGLQLLLGPWFHSRLLQWKCVYSDRPTVGCWVDPSDVGHTLSLWQRWGDFEFTGGEDYSTASWVTVYISSTKCRGVYDECC